MIRTAVAGDEPDRDQVVTSTSVTSVGGGFSLTVNTPPTPVEQLRMAGVVVEPLYPGDPAELVVDPLTGRGTIRRRRG